MSYITSILTKDEVVEFINKRVDDITIIRDLTNGVTVNLVYCHSKSGCPVEVSSKDIEGAVALAVTLDRA